MKTPNWKTVNRVRVRDVKEIQMDWAFGVRKPFRTTLFEMAGREEEGKGNEDETCPMEW